MNTVIIEKSKYSNNYQDVAFVCAAVEDKKSLRIVLQHVYVKDGLMIATDGNRLHTLSLYNSGIEVEDGFYTHIKTAKQVILTPAPDQDMTYPNYEQVMPLENELAMFTLGGSYQRERILTNYANSNNSGYSLNIEYLEVLPENMTMRVFDNQAPVLFENCTKTALIMPVRLK